MKNWWESLKNKKTEDSCVTPWHCQKHGFVWICAWAFGAGKYVNGSEQPKHLPRMLDGGDESKKFWSWQLPGWSVVVRDGDRNGSGRMEASHWVVCIWPFCKELNWTLEKMWAWDERLGGHFLKPVRALSSLSWQQLPQVFYSLISVHWNFWVKTS